MRSRAKRFHGLKRIKIRQTWNKYNFYNLTRLRAQPVYNSPFTHYQQKWQAKSITRAYHGEHIKEGQWELMFSSKIRSVIPMDPVYLGRTDGSEEAAGRGSGRETDHSTGGQKRSKGRKKFAEPIPYMLMTFAPIERRLDSAIFRALFASSTRQARQFVTHGSVKVNGKKMIYPGYLLNPGDMFQVDPERVLFATGASKDASERLAGRRLRRRLIKRKEAVEAQDTDFQEPEPQPEPSPEVPAQAQATELSEEQTAAKRCAHQRSLGEILKNAKEMMEVSKEKLPAKRKQSIRAFMSSVKAAIGKVNRTEISDLDTQLSSLLSKLEVSAPPTTQQPTRQTRSFLSEDELSEGLTDAAEGGKLSHADHMALREALQAANDNPVDSSKPYATPWRPRPYMSPFAFIPRYLEINQKICSAVYVRHPVARPGMTEVPSPFFSDTHQLAFTWYLRRR